MVFKPVPCRSRWEGLIACLWILLINMWLFTWMIRRPVDGIKFTLIALMVLSVPLLLYFAYRTWGAFTLEYWLDRNAVTIRWGDVRQIIPLTAIQSVIQPSAVTQNGVQPVLRRGWLQWPCPHVNATFDNERQPQQPITIPFASQPIAQCLLLDTGDFSFAISPKDQNAFLNAMQDRYQVGAALSLQIAQFRSTWPQRLFGKDRLGVVLLGFGILGSLILFGALMVPFPLLPEVIPFEFNSDGLPQVLREKSALFLLPSIGLLSWVANGLWGMWMASRNQLVGAYLLWGGTVVVQVCALLALMNLIV